MEVSNSFNRYDSTIQPNTSLGQTAPIKKTRLKSFFEAFKVDFSARALNSPELRDPNIKFPIHNSDVLQYSQNLELTIKP